MQKIADISNFEAIQANSDIHPLYNVTPGQGDTPATDKYMAMTQRVRAARKSGQPLEAIHIMREYYDPNCDPNEEDWDDYDAQLEKLKALNIGF